MRLSYFSSKQFCPTTVYLLVYRIKGAGFIIESCNRRVITFNFSVFNVRLQNKSCKSWNTPVVAVRQKLYFEGECSQFLVCVALSAVSFRWASICLLFSTLNKLISPQFIVFLWSFYLKPNFKVSKTIMRRFPLQHHIPFFFFFFTSRKPATTGQHVGVYIGGCQGSLASLGLCDWGLGCSNSLRVCVCVQG